LEGKLERICKEAVMGYRNQISRDDYRQQIDMEAAYSQETKTSQHHHQTIKLATGQKIKSSD
jgi:hypothetical protein